MSKSELFNDLVYQGFSENKNYDLIKHSMNRARELMLRHNVFRESSASAQYEMCLTIYIIATQSGSKAIHNFRIIAKPEERKFEYTLDEYFNPLKTIYIKEQKVVCNEKVKKKAEN